MSDQVSPLKKKSARATRVVAAHKHSVSTISLITRAIVDDHPDLDLSHLLLSLYLNTLGRIIEQDFERYCARYHHMGAAEGRILIALLRSRPAHAARPTDLFRGLYLTSGAVTKQVNRLTAKRLVHRIPDPSHRGGSLVQLTPAGLKTVNGIVLDVARGAATCPEMGDMPKTQRNNVIKFCFQVLNAVEASPARAKTRSRSRKKSVHT